MAHQPDGLDARWQQEQQQERGEPIELADLSPLEVEALRLLRPDEPRDLKLVAWTMHNEALEARWYAVQESLKRLGLVRDSSISGFVKLTAEGERLRAELNGGAS